MELDRTRKSSLEANECVDGARISSAPFSATKIVDLLGARDRRKKEDEEGKLLGLVYRSINSSNVVRAPSYCATCIDGSRNDDDDDDGEDDERNTPETQLGGE